MKIKTTKLLGVVISIRGQNRLVPYTFPQFLKMPIILNGILRCSSCLYAYLQHLQTYKACTDRQEMDKHNHFFSCCLKNPYPKCCFFSTHSKSTEKMQCTDMEQCLISYKLNLIFVGQMQWLTIVKKSNQQKPV